MKTLKKTLCLVLAVVMVVGVLILPASATDYVDDAEITHKEAVTVLTALGILTGDTEGFRPGDTLSRAEAATVISKLKETPAIAARYPAGKTGFTDVDGDKTLDWAAGFIAYCATKGIINGTEKGFEPDDNVTGTEFAKMLLCAVGYDAGIEGFIGNLWDINVISLALSVDLDEGIEDFDFDADLTRDNMAQLTYNALMSVKTVTYDNGKAKEGTTTLNEEKKYNVVVNDQLGADEFQRPESYSVKVGDKKVYNTYAGAVGEYKDTVTIKTLLTDLKLTGEVYVKHYIDGVRKLIAEDAEYSGNPGTVSATDTREISGSGKGAVTSVYKTTEKIGGKDTDLYVIATITSKVKLVTKDNLSDKGVLLIDKAEDKDDQYYTGEASVGDVVIYQATADKVTDAYVATHTTGKVTATGTDYIRIANGDKTYYAATMVPKTVEKPDFTTTYDVYTDSNGYIVYMKVPSGTTTPTDTAKNYAYLFQTQTKAAGGNGEADLFGTVANPTYDAAKKAMLLFLDGTLDVVDVAVVKATDDVTEGQQKVIEKGKWYLADEDGDPIKGTEIKETDKTAQDKYCFVSYVKTDKGYVLTEETPLTDIDDLKVQAGKALVEYRNNGEIKAYGTSTSVLTVITHDSVNNTYTVVSYTGYTKFVDINKTDAQGSIVSSKAEKAVIDVDATTKNIKQLVVMVTKDAAAPAPDNTVRGVYVSTGEQVATGTKYSFIVDGKVTEYISKDALTVKDNTVYTLTLNADNTIKSLGSAEAVVTDTLDRLSDDKAYIIVGTELKYLTPDCVIVDATGDAPAVVTALPENAKTVALYVTTSTDTAVAGQISLIVVTELKPA